MENNSLLEVNNVATSDKKKIKIIILIFSLIILILILIIIYISYNTNKKSNDENPIITLKGAPIIELGPGSAYVEQGYTAFDKEDGDLTPRVKVEHNINSNKAGIYIITYSVVDSGIILLKK